MKICKAKKKYYSPDEENGQYFYGSLVTDLEVGSYNLKDTKKSTELYLAQNSGYFPITVPIDISTLVEVTIEPKMCDKGYPVAYCLEDECFILRGKAVSPERWKLGKTPDDNPVIILESRKGITC